MSNKTLTAQGSPLQGSNLERAGLLYVCVCVCVCVSVSVVRRNKNLQHKNDGGEEVELKRKKELHSDKDSQDDTKLAHCAMQLQQL